jgi:hypothetical protein
MKCNNQRRYSIIYKLQNQLHSFITWVIKQEFRVKTKNLKIRGVKIEF